MSRLPASSVPSLRAPLSQGAAWARLKADPSQPHLAGMPLMPFDEARVADPSRLVPAWLRAVPGSVWAAEWWRVWAPGKETPRHELAEAVVRAHGSGGWRVKAGVAAALALVAERQRPRSVLEFGSGLSTLLWARLAEAGRLGEAPRIVTVDENPRYLAATEAKLRAAGLSAWVELIHAPLRQQPLALPGGEGSVAVRSYDAAMLARVLQAPAGLAPDLVFVDGPASWPAGPGNGQRWAVLPLVRAWLAPGAVVLLDDALRRAEQQALLGWSRAGLARVQGILPVGRGLAVAELG